MGGLADFHLLRPEWLWALLPLGLLIGLLWRSSRSGSGWSQVISPELLPHLMEQGLSRRQSAPLLALALAWFIATLALAGPSWEKIQQPVQKKQDALIVLLDLSYSMLARDLKPSRLARSRQKLLDLLQTRKEGLTALVAWAGDAHIVSPLTDDIRTIANLLPALDPGMMPVPGSRPVLAVEEALTLLHSAGAAEGQLLLVSDGVREADVDKIGELLARTAFTLSVLGVGSSEGNPIPMPDGSYLKDRDGQIVVAGLERNTLQRLAAMTGGAYSDLQLDDSDLQRVVLQANDTGGDSDWLDGRSVDTWHDMGFWLVLLLIPVCLGAFRRGWVLGVALLLVLPAEESVALDWRDLWQTPDQHAAQMLENGDAAGAAETFRNPDWSAAAHYRAEDYETAEKSFASGDDAGHWYNRGNALARSGKLDEAMAAYDEALQRDPTMEDAEFNRKLVEELQQQQQQQQQQQEQEQQQQQQQQQQQSDQQEQDQQQDAQDQGQQDESSQGESQQNDQQQASNSEQQDDSGGEQSGQEQTGEPQSPQDTAGQEQEEQSASQQEQQQAESGSDEQEAQAQAGHQRPLTEEEQEKLQATEQWLRRIPDDPSGLLRRKFRYESQQRAAENGTIDEMYW